MGSAIIDTTAAEHVLDIGESPAKRHWQLIAVSFSGERFPAIRIGDNPLQIGRDPRADVVIPHRTVSKAHAEVFAVGPEIFVRDLKSTNGTYLNRRRVRSLSAVSHGDRIQIGDIVFEVRGADLGAEQASLSSSATVISLDRWMTDDLDELLRVDGLYMVFQPIVRADSQQIVAFEAFVRSRIEGMESPVELFRLASQMNASKRFSQICRRMAASEAQQLPGAPPIFVNTSDREQLDEALLASLREVREEFPQVRLVVEVNENCVADPKRLDRFHLELSELGIGLALDGFGVGQSRLRDLRHFRPEYVKFDRSLIQDLHQESRSDRSWVKALVEAVHDAGIGTIAQGIECSASLDACRDVGFDLCQGFGTGVPAVASEWRDEAIDQQETRQDVPVVSP